MRGFVRELTTVLTSTMTTVRLLDTSTYTARELASCLFTGSARAYRSEGWGFESLRARPAQRCFLSSWRRRHWFFDDSFGDLMRGPGTGRPVVHGSEGRGFESVRGQLRGHTDRCPRDACQRQSASAITLGCHLADRRTTTRCGIDDSGSSGKSMLDPAAVFDSLLSVSDLES
jgi:hypothetical protein